MIYKLYIFDFTGSTVNPTSESFDRSNSENIDFIKKLYVQNNRNV